MHDFTRRLKKAMRDGDLTVADLARLFDRERRTVSDWVNNGRLPTGARADEAHNTLSELETQIRKNLGFPVPFYLSKRKRTGYIELLWEGDLERARLLAAGSAPKRLVRGIRKKDRAERNVSPAVVVSKNRIAARVVRQARSTRV